MLWESVMLSKTPTNDSDSRQHFFIFLRYFTPVYFIRSESIYTMVKALTIISAIVLFVCISISCSKGGGGGTPSLDCNTVPNKAFTNDVSPIFQSSCAIIGCHEAGSINGPGPLTSYNEIFNARTAIQTAVSAGTMPKTGSLATSQKNSLLCWIQGGAPNN